MIKSNPITTGWVTHKLENNNTKVLALFWRFWIRVFQAWGFKKGTGNPQGIWPWRPAGFDYNTSTGLGETETPVLEWKYKTLHASRLRRKEQWPHRRLSQNYLLVLEGLLWRHGSTGAHHRDGGTGSCSPGRLPWVLTLLVVTINPKMEPTDHRAHRACLSQAKKITRKGAKPHPPADNWIKALLSKALSTRARLSFSHHHTLPSGGLHKPLSLLHQRADRRRKKDHSPTVTKTKPLYSKLISMKKQKNISQMSKIKSQKHN